MIRLLLLLIVLLLSFHSTLLRVASESNTEVRVRVGEFYLSLHGFASPNASIVIKKDNTLLGSGKADEEGVFAFTGIPISRGFSSFCLETVDQGRLGSSLGCMAIAPASTSIELRDIYLPPTIGLEKNTIDVGSPGLTYGYSMPLASVAVRFAAGTTLSTQADTSGRYSYTLADLKEGTYDLTASGEYTGKKSLEPASKVSLKVLTSSTSFVNEAGLFRNELEKFIPWILLVLLVGILVGFGLMYKFRPEWIRGLKRAAWSIIPRKDSRKLHHAWFVGY